MEREGMKFLLDSVILIDHFNKVIQATDYLSVNHNECVLSVITQVEVLAGFEGAALKKAKQLLDCFPLLEFTGASIDLVAKLRREHKWKLPDAIQAAIARQHNLKLVTRNIKDFGQEHQGHNGFVIIPYQLAR